jgi:energy-coupling factor transporter ATP-binding protein EcfA2
MLKSFQVSNFRLFRHLEVGKLSRVNLVVGENNSGKSTFLEALQLYASNAYSYVLLDILEARQETWFSEAQPYYQSFLSHPLRHLFFGHQLPKLGEGGISLGEVASSTMLHINVAAYQNKNDGEGAWKKIRVSSAEFDEELANIEFFLVREEGKRSRRLFELDRDIRDIQRVSRLRYEERIGVEVKYTWQIVSTENMPDRTLAALWDSTSLTKLESEIISALGLIDSRISGVAFVQDLSKGTASNNRIPLVKIDGIDEPLPMKSMGDGITRLFHIIVALVNAKNGLLLIDEFENGLHWSIQPKVWDIIFQLSERLNVQVFATTHSRDCVSGFESAWNKYPESGTFFRLDAKDSLVKSVEYTAETLTDAIDMDVEVR